MYETVLSTWSTDVNKAREIPALARLIIAIEEAKYKSRQSTQGNLKERNRRGDREGSVYIRRYPRPRH